jgi:hypothetical protein
MNREVADAMLVIDPDEAVRQRTVDAVREPFPQLIVSGAANLDAVGSLLPPSQDSGLRLRLILVDAAATPEKLPRFLQQLLGSEEIPVPVVVWSAPQSISPDVRETLYNAGVASILERPPVQTDLAKTVEHLCRYWIFCNERPGR